MIYIKKIVNLEKTIEKLNLIIEEKVLAKDSEFHEFYCNLLNTYENTSWIPIIG